MHPRTSDPPNRNEKVMQLEGEVGDPLEEYFPNAKGQLHIPPPELKAILNSLRASSTLTLPSSAKAWCYLRANRTTPTAGMWPGCSMQRGTLRRRTSPW